MKFYVYEHWRLDKNQCFYVGKGKGKRAYEMRKRNPHHGAILKHLENLNLQVEIRIVAYDLEEEKAYALECERISYWRSKGINLSNKTDGGKGFSGWATTPEQRKKINFANSGDRRKPRKPFTEEQRKRISERMKGNKNKIGNKLSNETKKKMSDSAFRANTPEVRKKKSESRKGMVFSLEHRLNISLAQKEQKRTLGIKLGPLSSEQKIQRSESMKAHWARVKALKEKSQEREASL